LYKKYLECEKQGTFKDYLDYIYEEGRALNWRAPHWEASVGGVSKTTTAQSGSMSVPGSPGQFGKTSPQPQSAVSERPAAVSPRRKTKRKGQNNKS